MKSKPISRPTCRRNAVIDQAGPLLSSERHIMKTPHSILVINTRRLGDVLLSTPVIRSLKRAWPQANIDVLVFEGSQGVLAANQDVHTVLTIPERPSKSAHWALCRTLFRRYDLAISLIPGDRPTLYAWLAGRYRAGFFLDEAQHRWKRHLLHVHLAFDNLETSTVRMNLALVKALGVQPIAEVVTSWTGTDAEKVDELLRGIEHFAVLHSYPKFRYKMWHLEGWKTVGEHLRDQGLQVVLTGSSSPEEMSYVQSLRAMLPGSVNLCGQLNLAQTAYVLSRAQFYVGPDTAVTHMAAAVGTSVVALFGPSNPVKWGPWPLGWSVSKNPFQKQGTQRAGNVMLVQGEVHDERRCVPCLYEGCERHEGSSSDCLQQLSGAQVVDKIEYHRRQGQSSAQ